MYLYLSKGTYFFNYSIHRVFPLTHETNYCIGFEVSEGRKLLCRLGQEISVRENGRTIGTFVVSDYEEATVKYEDVE